MARKAYLGLSSPLGYNYDIQLGRQPNPILESPMGLFLLYDEIWFLHPDLCPKNMRDLDYVKFVSDSYSVNRFKEIVQKKENEVEILGDNTEFPWDLWSSIITEIAPFAEAYDDHTMSIADTGLVGTSKYVGNIGFDIITSNELGFEYVLNSSVNRFLSSREHISSDVRRKSELSHRLISKRIPNFQFKKGPYFEGIDDIRNSKYVGNFRNEIEDRSKNSEDLERTISNIEHEFKQVTNESFLQSTEYPSVYSSSIDFIVGSSLPPLASHIYDIINLAKEVRDKYQLRKEFGWAAMLAQIENNKFSDGEV